MTVLDEHHDILPVAAPADFGVGSGPAWLDAWLAAHAGELVGWRRSLHAVPELGRAERRTTAFVAAALMAGGLEPRTLPGGTGLVCDIGFGERCVALRADLDALPLQEYTGLHAWNIRAENGRLIVANDRDRIDVAEHFGARAEVVTRVENDIVTAELRKIS